LNGVGVKLELIQLLGNGKLQMGTHTKRCLDTKISFRNFPSCEGNRLASGKFIHEPNDLDKRTSYLEAW
jgi:hypothetical protein